MFPEIYVTKDQISFYIFTVRLIFLSLLDHLKAESGTSDLEFIVLAQNKYIQLKAQN